MSKTLYSHDPNSVEHLIRKVISEIRKTEIISNDSNLPSEDRLTQKEGADFLGISITSIINWKKQRKMAYLQIGRSIFYSKKELLKIARQEREML